MFYGKIHFIYAFKSDESGRRSAVIQSDSVSHLTKTTDNDLKLH